MNEMKPIMEGWRTHLILTEQQLLEEQLLLEGFLSSLRQLGGDVKGLFKTVGNIMRDKGRIDNFVGLLQDKVIDPARKEILDKLKTVKIAFGDGDLADDANFINKVISKIEAAVKRVEQFLANAARGTWKRAATAIGVAAGFAYFAFEKMASIPVGDGLEAILNYFKEDIMKYLNDFFGEALVTAVTGAISGGVATFAKVLAKVTQGTVFLAQALAPAIRPFQAGGVSITREYWVKI